MKACPRLLDLFCGAGGAAMGYHRAGFDVVGVDNRPQKRYPFEFHQADALQFCAEHGHEYDAIHASPPCQRYSAANRQWKRQHPDLIPAVRQILQETGKPFVIENVEGSPLYCPALVCGLALGLGVKRHRLFEGSELLFSTRCPPGHRGDYLTIYGHDVTRKVGGKGWVTVYGGGAPRCADKRRRADFKTACMAMGIDWMTRDELSQAIPPAYTEFIGKQLLRILENS